MHETSERDRPIVVPIGGGGLIAGIALAVKHLAPKVRIVGVERGGALPAEQVDAPVARNPVDPGRDAGLAAVEAARAVLASSATFILTVCRVHHSGPCQYGSAVWPDG